jgi:hypothetical protein
MNKNLAKLSFILLCVFCFTVSVEAQKKKPTSKKPTTTPVVSNIGVKDGANKVSIQIKNLTKYLYSLGGVARAYEDLGAEVQNGKATKTGIDLYARNKQTVLTTMRNFRAGLAALEVEFRTKPELKLYVGQIQGITDLCGQAEDLANSGRFLDSGKSLLVVVEKLSDTLAALP